MPEKIRMKRQRRREMEKQNDENQHKKAVQKQTMILLAVMTGVIFAYVIYGLVTKSINMLIFEVLLGAFVILYLVMTDVVEPWRLGMFQDLSEERRAGYVKMMLMDVVGAGALLYWIIGMNSETGSNNILFPLLIYFLSSQIKRKYRAEFEG